MRELKVKVTKTDIKTGVCGDASKCAIAQALRRIGCGRPSVCGDTIDFVRGGKAFSVATPADAVDFIGQFDEDKSSVSPISFTLSY